MQYSGSAKKKKNDFLHFHYTNTRVIITHGAYAGFCPNVASTTPAVQQKVDSDQLMPRSLRRILSKRSIHYTSGAAEVIITHGAYAGFCPNVASTTPAVQQKVDSDQLMPRSLRRILSKRSIHYTSGAAEGDNDSRNKSQINGLPSELPEGDFTAQ
ncbi:hypothetical protein BD560DRAFT_428627 [Blakeslea trispora]|nr:hypothetical protein BD560DRAFT_428627 [Blakeslea trispora]